MKKVIIGLCIVVTGFILFIAQDEFEGNDTANGIEKMFSGQIFDVAQEKFTVHSMGLSQKKMSLQLELEKHNTKNKQRNTLGTF